MSLVAYGSSDESSDDEGNNCSALNKNKDASGIAIERTNDKLCLPTPKHDILVDSVTTKEDVSIEKIHFDKLPKPKSLITETEDIVEEGDIPPKTAIELKSQAPIKKDRLPVKITVPSLSEFKDVDEENETKSNRTRPSDKGTKLFALLPPPKGFEVKSINLIPNAVNKAAAKTSQVKAPPIKDNCTKNSGTKTTTKPEVMKSSIGINYDSNSEDEDDTAMTSGSNPTTDFFALAATTSHSALSDSVDTNIDLDSITSELKKDSKKGSDSYNYTINSNSSNTDTTETCFNNAQTTLVSNIMSLPKEEILQKNKAEVGPKLPVPEQEYNVDVEGNVAFDDKAIEYLCGRRGVKRKPKEIEDVNIIEISGEDIKPDEREWLVKALTEEPVQRPISMQGGVNSQSKKKHQITYLAHQAKAMEMELKNQWAQNRLTRKQTQSKYGF